MANAWGELSWSTGDFGSQNNATVEVTGAPSLSVTSGTGTEIDTTVEFGWGRLQWSENAWGIAGDVIVTGVGLDVGVGTGSVTAGAGVFTTGQQLNLNTGAVTAFGLAEVDVSGFTLTADLGNLDPAPDVMLTGVGLTTTVGTAQGYNEQGWGRDDWGTEVWGAEGLWQFVDVTGNEITVSLNSVTATPNTQVDLTSPGLTIAEGTVDPSPDATVTGIGMTVGLGLGTIVSGTAEVDVTGEQLNLSLASVDVDAITFADTTGQQLNTALGTAIAGTSVNPSLVNDQLGLTIAEGIVDPAPDATVTGIGMTVGVGLGTVEGTGNVDITGQQINLEVESVTTQGNANIFPTGIGLTTGLRNINVQSWQIVDTGTSVNWNEIDTAA